MLFMDNALSMFLYVQLKRDASCFLPAESRDCIYSTSNENKEKSARRVAQFVLDTMAVMWLE